MQQQRPIWAASDALYPEIYFESPKNDAGLGGKPAGFDRATKTAVVAAAVRAAKSVRPGFFYMVLKKRTRATGSTEYPLFPQNIECFKPFDLSQVGGRPVLPFAATYCAMCGKGMCPCYSNGTFPLEPWAGANS